MPATYSAPAGPPTVHFSSDALPERGRFMAWRELYGRHFLRLEHESLPGTSFHGSITLRMLPGLCIATGAASLLRVGRTRELIADGNDNLTLQIATAAGVASQLGREAPVDVGDAILMSNCDVGHFTFHGRQSSEVLALSLPRKSLGHLLRDPEAFLLRAVPRDSASLWLLKRYLAIVEDVPAVATPELQNLAVTHVYDLLAMAFGAPGDSMEIAKGRGVRAARLHAAKAFIIQHHGRHELSAATVAAHLGVTPRYVHMLFETEDASFTTYVLSQRLAHAYRVLADPLFGALPISTIAFDAGFGDLSHFNRSFRRQFGRTPSDLRAEARRKFDRS